MSKILNFDMFVTEGVKDYLKPKSKEELMDSIKPYINKPDELLRMSCYIGLMEGVEMAIRKGADPSMRLNEPIGLATYFNHPDIVEYLLTDQRVDASDLDNYAIQTAEQYKYKDIISLLLKDSKVRRKLSRFKIGVLNKLIK